jgi:hypothetical protein
MQPQKPSARMRVMLMRFSISASRTLSARRFERFTLETAL